MATLRQKEIDEILNNDRTMNRRVLDRTISQVASFNDERSAPNTQDIKLEAIIGSLVDNLKASIAEALKLIAAKQFPVTNDSNAAAILGAPVGVTGMTANDPNSKDTSKLENNQGTTAVKLKAGGKPMSGGDVAFETAILKNKQKKISDNDDNNQGYRFTSSLPSSYQKRMNDDMEYLESDIEDDEESIEGGYCGMGFGIRRRRKRRMTGGADEAPGAPTMKSATVSKSTAQTENTVENALYNIINQYNGIVDKILQATREGGVLKNKRLASASIVSFMDNVLKGLIEPLKHLLYELALVKDKDVASMWTMMKSMVDNIQDAPPFQKVDFRIYKTPATDYQRLNRDLRIDNYDGKIAELKTKGDDLQMRLKQLNKDASHIEYAMEDKSEQYKKEMKSRLFKKQQDILAAIEQQKKDMGYVVERKKSGLPYDSQALKDTTQDILTKEKVLPVVSGVFTELALNTITDENQLRAVLDNQRNVIKSIKDQERALRNKAQTQVLTEGDEDLIKALVLSADKMKPTVSKIIKHLELVKGKKKETVEANRMLFEFKEQAAELTEIDKKLNESYALIKEAEAKKAELESKMANQTGEEQAEEQAEDTDGNGKPIYGKGKPKADLLAKPKQQYNSMQRPITDDDKAHKEVVARNQKWQVSNPIHTTPIGSKNPFYAQQPDAKYDFRTILGKENSVLYPKTNALGADVSLLQGEIGGPSEQAKEKRKYKKPEKETRSAADALRNILNQNVYEGGAKKQPGSLRKLVFEDEDNDLFDEEELPVNKGFIKEDKDDRFKLPDIKKEQAKKKKGRL
jgi:hypothetical protein